MSRKRIVFPYLFSMMSIGFFVKALKDEKEETISIVKTMRASMPSSGIADNSRMEIDSSKLNIRLPIKQTIKDKRNSMIAMMTPWVNTVEIVEDFFAPNAFMIPNSLSISFMFVWKKFRDRIMPTMTKHVTIPKITTLAKSLIIAILEEKPLYLPAR